MNNKPNSAAPWRKTAPVEDAQTRRLRESLLRGDELRHKTATGWALGTFVIELPTRSTLAILAAAGFDFVVLDMEHSALDFSSLEALIVASDAVGLATLVRVWGKDIGLIGKVLDIGAHGIMAPHVETAEHAREIVAQARFPPRGSRGFSPLARFDPLGEPLRSLDEATYVVVQIEGQTGLAHAREIASVPGLDAVFVGPYDLSLSLGVPPGSPQVFAAAERIAAVVPQDVHLGIYIDDPAQTGSWAARRFGLQCVSFDGRMLAESARLVAEQARRSIAEHNLQEKTE